MTDKTISKWNRGLDTSLDIKKSNISKRKQKFSFKRRYFNLLEKLKKIENDEIKKILEDF